MPIRKRQEEEKMKRRSPKMVFLVMSVFLACVFLFSFPAFAKETKQKWEILNPEGVVKIEPMKINPHPSTLDGKTVMLRWNGKHNGDQFLSRVGELLKEKVKDVRIIKSWEVAPETVDPIAGSHERSQEFARAIAKFKPDIVIGAQSD
jgi:hypothetical protein